MDGLDWNDRDTVNVDDTGHFNMQKITTFKPFSRQYCNKTLLLASGEENHALNRLRKRDSFRGHKTKHASKCNQIFPQQFNQCKHGYKLVGFFIQHSSSNIKHGLIYR